MSTTNTSFSTLITAIDTKAQSLASSTTDAKDLVYLGKAIEALNIPDTVSAVIDEGTTQVARVTSEGTTQVAAVQAAASGFATQADIDTSVSALVDSAPGTLDTLNELAAALGDDANFSTTVTNSIATKLPLAGGTMTGNLITPSATVNGTLEISEVVEKVGLTQNGSSTFNLSILDQAILYFNANQATNKTVNIRGDGSNSLNSVLDIGQSATCTVLLQQGSTAYYINAYQVDGSAVTPKWSGGSAPTEGNASGIDVYTFTIIKTADATFTVLASQSQYA